jgi:hypothetical protein
MDRVRKRKWGRMPSVPFQQSEEQHRIDIHLKNSGDSAMMHSVDFHAATGPGGGAAALQVEPGKEKSMTWKALTSESATREVTPRSRGRQIGKPQFRTRHRRIQIG